MQRNVFNSILMCVLSFVFSNSIVADDNTTDPNTPPDRPLIPISAGTTYQFGSNLGNSGASFFALHSAIDIDAAYRLNDQFKIVGRLSPEYSYYDWSKYQNVLPGVNRPIRDGLSVRLIPALEYRANKEWTYFAGPILQFSGEPNAEFVKSLTFGGIVGATKTFGNNFSITFGFTAKTRLEHDPIIVPFIGFEYKFSDQLTLAARGKSIFNPQFIHWNP